MGKKQSLKCRLWQIKWNRFKAGVGLCLQKTLHRISYVYHHHITCFDRIAYGFRLLDVEFLLKIFGVIGSGKIILDTVILLLKEDLSFLELAINLLVLILLVTAFIVIAWAMFRQMASWKKNVVELDGVSAPLSWTKADLRTDKYLRNGYKVIEDPATKKHYIMSKKVNRLLYEDRWRRSLAFAGEYMLPEQCSLVAPYYLHKTFMAKKQKGIQLYLSNLIGLMDDLTADAKDAHIRLVKTNYFDFLLSNEGVDKDYLPINAPDQKKIEGHKLIYNEEGKLLNYSESLCADVLGGSSLAITNDGYVIMQMQSGSADRNPETIVPSASGSTDYNDFKTLQIKTKASPFWKAEGSDFRQLIIDTVHRELIEENGFDPKGSIADPGKMKTKVIGFARLMDRGAKPDFFAITFINASAHELYPQMNQNLDRLVHVLKPNKKTDKEIFRHILIPYQDNKFISREIRHIISNGLESIACCNPSFQTAMLLDLIDSYYEEGFDIFEEVKQEAFLHESFSFCQPPEGEDGFGLSESEGFAYVIDGASDLIMEPKDQAVQGEEGGFSARDFTLALKEELDRRLADKNKDLQTILYETIREIRRKNPGARKSLKRSRAGSEKSGPSAAITIIRLKDGRLEYYSLGDCLLSVMYSDGDVEVFENQDLVKLDNKIFHYMRSLAEARGAASVKEAAATPEVFEEKMANRNLKNEEGGYWILDLTGQGISRASYRSFNPDNIDSLVLMSDGISDLYKGDLTQEEVHQLLMENHLEAVESLKKEYQNDPDWTKYPRFKAIDDTTIVGLKVVPKL